MMASIKFKRGGNNTPTCTPRNSAPLSFEGGVFYCVLVIVLTVIAYVEWRSQ